MPKRFRNEDNCWSYRTGLEKFLIGFTILALIVFVILLIFVITQFKADSPSIVNVKISLINEISQINQRIDPTINPCDDFYNFACGNLLKNAHGDETLGPFFIIQNKVKHQIQEMYSEKVRNDDHQAVKVAKLFFRACLNESLIEQDGLVTITKILKSIGGWPVVEGNNWNQSEFWWMQTEYKLRELGYFYSSFLGVKVEVDPRNDHKFIFKLAMPDFEDIKVDLINKQRRMVDIAVAFGANEGRALIEMSEVYDFMLDMQKEVYSRRNDDSVKRSTISDFQKRHKFINWIEFMDNIIGSSVQISIDDYVLFPSPQHLHAWYNFLSQTPKRIQANYMIWKVLEDVIPYIPELQSYQTNTHDFETRSEFCIHQIRERFKPSPIDIMYVRKHLSEEKVFQIKEIINNMKTELKSVLEKTDWLIGARKYDAIKKINDLTEMIGAPDDFFEDDVLDDLHFDMKSIENHTFIAMLAILNRNHQSWLYNQMYSTRNEFKLTHWNLQTVSAIGDYCHGSNMISLPATIFQDVIFDENRPKYFNYGSLGTMMGHHFFYVLSEPAKIFDIDGNIIEGWSNVTSNFFRKKSNCFTDEIRKLNITNVLMIDLIFHQSLGLKIAYSAYNKWVYNQKEKDHILHGIPYTPKQLFWISAASYFCQPSNAYSAILNSSEERHFFSYLVKIPMLNNPYFAEDFNCPLDSNMNPSHKCEMF